ncbi:hypothetical protein [Solimonas flava]|uniref:hypothetical protein n=1 Tax=Solimonas flava TaxID=415849 RepID=UPI000413887D|nr:hypothetical protein [Solimonas flava]
MAITAGGVPEDIRWRPELEAGEATDGSDTLDLLLAALLGGGPKLLGDAGLARLSEARLQAIERGALARADDCLHELQCLARLLADATRVAACPPPAHDLARVTRHLGRLAQDGARWKQLAEHAAMYRAQRDLAGEVARRWLGWARYFGEWPQPAGDAGDD